MPVSRLIGLGPVVLPARAFDGSQEWLPDRFDAQRFAVPGAIWRDQGTC